MTSLHVNCTCCRHWRVVEQMTSLEVDELRGLEAEGKVVRLPHPPLLPPAPMGATAPITKRAARRDR